MLDESYAERVAYRLKKWCGVEVEPPHYNPEPKGPPHEIELCEGCKDGHCAEMDRKGPSVLGRLGLIYIS